MKEKLHKKIEADAGYAQSAVNSPIHYTPDEIECIDGIKAALGHEGFAQFCRGNAMKYVWRAGRKSDRREDMQKAIWYSRMAIGDDPRGEVSLKIESKVEVRLEDINLD